MNQHEQIVFDGLKAENRKLKEHLIQVSEAQDQQRMIGGMLQAVMSGLCANKTLQLQDGEEGIIAKKAIALTNAVFAEMGKEK